jgi:arylsulfatase
VFTYNLGGVERVRWEAPQALAPGKHTLAFDYKYDGLGFATLAFNNLSGIGRAGTGALSVDGKAVATQKMARSTPLVYNLDDTFSIGTSSETPLDDRDYKVPFPFTGKLTKLTIAVDEPKLTPEDIKKLEEAKRKQD